MRTIRVIAMAAGVALVVAACGGDDDTASAGSIAVGSKEFNEQQLLGQIAIQALEDAGYDVEDVTGVEGTENVRAGLEAGDIDMYWEYTGTGYTTILGHDSADAPTDPQELYDQVAAEDAENGMVWLEPAEASNGYALAGAADMLSSLGVATLSDYAALANSNPDDASLCAAAEFLDRADGFIGLQEHYGFELADGAISEMDLDVIYTQVTNSDPCNFGEVFETDGRIVGNDLQVLEDDQQFFIKYNIVPVIREDALDANPDVEAIFNSISALLTTKKMSELNARVDVDEEEPADVARDFLETEGLIGG